MLAQGRLTSNIEGNKVINQILQVNTSTGIRAGHSDDLGQDIIRDHLFISNGFEPLSDTVLTDLTHGTYGLSIAFSSKGMKELYGKDIITYYTAIMIIVAFCSV